MVYDVAQVSPLQPARKLSARLGAPVWLKREDAQPVHSFKLRGAYNRIARLSPSQRESGVVAASAGNHAQGVALAGQTLGIRTTIVMPETTPSIKVDAVRALGAEVVLIGDAYDDALAHAMTLVEQRGQTFIHPYDDPWVMAGQGTVARELLDQHSDPIARVYIPVGGGGLVGGMAAYLKQRRPEIEVVAVEPVDSACLHHALAAGERVVLDQVGLFADGVAVRQIGAYPYAVARRCVDRTVQVSIDEICAAMRAVFEAVKLNGYVVFAACHGKEQTVLHRHDRIVTGKENKRRRGVGIDIQFIGELLALLLSVTFTQEIVTRTHVRELREADHRVTHE